MKRTFTAVILVIWSISVVYTQDTFTEVSQEAGINHVFRIDLATFGGGVAVIDIDNDGWEDLYVTGGSKPDALFRNNGDGSFSNIFYGAGMNRTLNMYTQGVSAADINRDGFKDIIVTTMYFLTPDRDPAPNLLYLNNGDGTFEDVTQQWGLEQFRSNSQGANFGDLNADGYADLFIANYYSNSPQGISVYNEPTITNSFVPGLDFLFLNANGEAFINAAGIYGMKHDGFGFQGVFTDYDNDRDVDLYIANDFGFKKTPNVLLRNDFPERKLTDRSLNVAMNYGMNAMGITAADYNFDGWMDYFVTNLSTSLFLENAKDGAPFIQSTVDVGLAITTIEDPVYTGLPISWGANFFDYDNDTDLDLFVNNGALNPTIRANPNLFFVCEDGKFTESARTHNLFDERIGRGSAVFDYDRDGDLDLFVVNQKPRDITTYLPRAQSLLYRNDNPTGNWLKVELEGVKAEKNGISSRVEVVVNGKLLVREIEGGSSHLSQNSTIAHFGLGDADNVESITVKWMGGGEQVLTNVEANQHLKIVEEIIPAAEQTAIRLDAFPGFVADYLVMEYEVGADKPFELSVYDVQGRLIKNFNNLDPGTRRGVVQWDVPENLIHGVYIVTLRTNSEITARRVVKL